MGFEITLGELNELIEDLGLSGLEQLAETLDPEEQAALLVVLKLKEQEQAAQIAELAESTRYLDEITSVILEFIPEHKMTKSLRAIRERVRAPTIK